MTVSIFRPSLSTRLAKAVRALFSTGTNGYIYDPSDMASLYQDSAGTTPVTAVTNPVGKVSDKSGNTNHALQATAAARPTWTNRVNLLTYTEQFDNAAWTKYDSTIAANTTTAPDGTLTADKLVSNTALSSHTAGIAVGTGLFTLSFYTKAAEYTAVSVATTPDNYIHYNLTTGVVSSAGTGWASGSMVDVGGGWWKCTAVNAASKNWANAFIYVNNAWQNNGNSGNGLTFLGDGTSGIYVWGAQLEVGTASTTYQRVTTATDFDTVGFPYYLSFLGTDDSLSSATGGGGSAGFFWCGVVQPTGGAGTARAIFYNYGPGAQGYILVVNTDNTVWFRVGNGAAFTDAKTAETVSVGSKYLITAWDDGVNLNIQLNNNTVVTVARPVVVAGPASFTVGVNNQGALYHLIGNLYASVYARNTGLTAAQRATIQAWVKQKAGIV